MSRNAAEVSLDGLLTHAAWARRLARSLVADDGSADDAVQDALEMAVRRPPATEGSLRAWLRTVLTNQRIKRVTSDRRRLAREQAVAALASEEFAVSPEELAARVETQRLLAELVLALDEPYRQTVVLRYYEDLTSAEIASVLGAPAGTVRWRLKEGLERLRAQLARRSGGDPGALLRVIAPLLGPDRRGQPDSAVDPIGGVGNPTRGRMTLPRAGLALGAAGVLGLALLLAPQRTSVPPKPVLAAADRANAETRAAPSPAKTPPSGTAHAPMEPSARPAAVAIASDELTACRAELAWLVPEVANAENQALSTVLPHHLFRRGAPNWTAEAALRPEIERAFSGDQATTPSYALECRTWACKLTVIGTEQQLRDSERWMHPLGRPERSSIARLRRYAYVSGGKVRDPLAGVPLERSFVYWALAHPSGKPVTIVLNKANQSWPWLPRVELPPLPLPASPAACRREAARLERRLAAARDDITANDPPAGRFQKARPNPALSAEITRELRRALGSPAPDSRYSAECRADVCLLKGPEPWKSWRKQLHADAALTRRFGAGSVGLDWYVTIKQSAELATVLWIEELFDRLARSADVAACAERYPAITGRLSAWVVFAPIDGSPPAQTLTPSYGGAVAGTALADCVHAAFEGLLAGADLPAEAVATETSVAMSFPLPPR